LLLILLVRPHSVNGAACNLPGAGGYELERWVNRPPEARPSVGCWHTGTNPHVWNARDPQTGKKLSDVFW
jgi:hypothetical protein